MSGPLREVILPGFFMSRQEVTTRDWFEFVNDEETLKHIAESGETRFLPSELGPFNFGGAKVGSSKIGTSEICSVKIATAKVGFAEVCSIEKDLE
jgi:formylglycine-generating enzyme required for sulfatase activity